MNVPRDYYVGFMSSLFAGFLAGVVVAAKDEITASLTSVLTWTGIIILMGLALFLLGSHLVKSTPNA